MRIHFPAGAFLGNIDPFLRSFDPSNPDELVVTSNLQWVNVHPVVLAMVTALGMKVGVDHIDLESFEAASKNYFERMGLFKFLGVESGIEINKRESAGRFIPITQILDSESKRKFLTEMVPLLHLKPEQARPITYVLDELIRNVLEHARTVNGAIAAAQYYKEANVVRVGVADTGLGIRNTIMHSHSATDDLDAIRLALTPGITGTTRKEGGTEQNAGAGLFFVKSIASASRSFFMVYSGNSMYKLLKKKVGIPAILEGDPLKDRHSSQNDLPYWQGTVVGVDIDLNSTVEFVDLLDLMNDAFIRSIRSRKLVQAKKPRFV